MVDSISEIASSSLAVVQDNSAAESATLGQDEFLELMLTQMRNQDPFKPTDNGEFITQMAQFSQVSSTDAMRTSMEKFVEDQSTAQLLNAASLVGRSAMIDSNQGVLADDKPIDIEYSLPVPTENVSATVSDESGSVIYTVDMGSMGSGTHSMQWNGTKSAGDDANPGNYNINIQYLDTNGESVAAPVKVKVDIESVNLGINGTGLSMETGDGREVQISDVYKFL